jgi:hypothetical protein
MKILSMALVLAILAWVICLNVAHAQTTTCNVAGNSVYCNSTPGPDFSDDNPGLASHYAMVNAYREAHGLPRCHWGFIGRLRSAQDGRPMC